MNTFYYRADKQMPVQVAVIHDTGWTSFHALQIRFYTVNHVGKLTYSVFREDMYLACYTHGFICCSWYIIHDNTCI